jgi:lactaldehyde reductase
MGNRIILNGTSYFGRGSRENLITELNGRHFSKALIVTDRGLRDAGVVDLITKELDKNNFDYVIYDEVKPNPTVQNVKDGVEFCKNNSCDVIVAIGGGSSIDTAKGVSIIMTNPEHSDVVSLDGAVETKNPGMPIIALPTTAGTAAEVTINYVITDPERVKKMVCVDPHDIPLVAIIDQELMAKMPKSLAAYTGMDALTHAMEGYTTKAAWLMTDMYHLNAMALIYKNLEKAVNEKDDEAIDNVIEGLEKLYEKQEEVREEEMELKQALLDNTLYWN